MSLEKVKDILIDLDIDNIQSAVQVALEDNSPEKILEVLSNAMLEVGRLYEEEEYFLPELVLEVNFRGGQENVNAWIFCALYCFPCAVNVQPVAAGQRDHLGSLNLLRDPAHGLKIALGSNGKACLNGVHPQFFQLLRHH